MILSLVLAAALVPADVERIVGRKAAADGGEVKVAVPHPELGVTVDGFPIVPEMGVTSWVAFTGHGEQAMAMGDVVVLEDELKAVQSEAVAAGLEITAIHNHFLRDKPKVMYMHLAGHGPLEKLGASVRRVLDRQKELRVKRKPGPSAVKSSLDVAKIAAALGAEGKLKDGVYKVVLGRPDVPLTDHGAPVSKFLGFNTWAAFQGTDKRAAVSGDFAMKAAEVEGVVRELVSHGIEVTAIHNHMVTEEPRIFFLHFWGVAELDRLLDGLKAALAKTR